MTANGPFYFNSKQPCTLLPTCKLSHHCLKRPHPREPDNFSTLQKEASLPTTISSGLFINEHPYDNEVNESLDKTQRRVHLQPGTDKRVPRARKVMHACLLAAEHRLSGSQNWCSKSRQSGDREEIAWPLSCRL